MFNKLINDKEILKANLKFVLEQNPELLREGVFAGQLTRVIGEKVMLTITPELILAQHTTLSDEQRSFEKKIIDQLTPVVVDIGAQGITVQQVNGGLCEYDGKNFHLFQVQDYTVFGMAEPADICNLYTNHNDHFYDMCANICTLSADIQCRFETFQKNVTEPKTKTSSAPFVEHEFYDPTANQAEKKYS